MIISVASGKGGTGKTTIAVNLAFSIPTPSASRGKVRLLDCDVEEPNCHIFLKPDIQWTESVGIPVPSIDESKCTACGECGRICQYHAIVSLKAKALVFPELCHGCGGCARVCPTGAIREVKAEIGIIEGGVRDQVKFVQGRMKIGQAMSPPLIRAVKQYAAADDVADDDNANAADDGDADDDGLTIIDCPPGTSCPVITAIRGSD